MKVRIGKTADNWYFMEVRCNGTLQLMRFGKRRNHIRRKARKY